MAIVLLPPLWRAGVRLHEPLDRAERSGLAGAVGTKQTEDLSLFDLEVHSVHRAHVAVGDVEIANLEGDSRIRRRRLF